jgi:thioesterase domain-containing protein
VLLFPGLGGDDRELAALRIGCSPALRCATVEYPDWTEIYTKPLDLDGLIAHCVERVNALAPHGGLRLAGYSFGGTMAYAVAAALVASGRRVDRLGLVDAPANPHVATTPLSLQGRWRRLADAIRARELPREIGGTIAGAVMRSGNARLLLGLGRLRRFNLPFAMQAHLNKPITCRLREKLLLDLIERMQADQPELDVPGVLFRSTQQHEVDAAPDLGWNRHLGSLQIINLPGDHHTVIKPENVGVLCTAFVQAMGDPAPRHDGKLLRSSPTTVAAIC